MIESFLQSSIRLFKLYSEWLSFSHFSVFVYGQVENSETSETSESSEFCFRRSLFRLFDFDLTPKIENSEKKFRAFRAFQTFRVSESHICHF